MWLPPRPTPASFSCFICWPQPCGEAKVSKNFSDCPNWQVGALELEPLIQRLVERYRFINHCLVVGRGLIYANVYELAIKLMETCYVVSERFSSADFLHGPVAMIEADFPVIVFAPPGKTYNDMLQLTRQLRTLQAETLVISSEASILKQATRALRIPVKIDEFLAPIPYIIPGQLFAAMLAGVKGLSPDRPTIAEEGNQDTVRN